MHNFGGFSMIEFDEFDELDELDELDEFNSPDGIIKLQCKNCNATIVTVGNKRDNTVICNNCQAPNRIDKYYGTLCRIIDLKLVKCDCGICKETFFINDLGEPPIVCPMCGISFFPFYNVLPDKFEKDI